VNRSEREGAALKRHAVHLLKPAAFLVFTGYVVDVAVRATGPAIDIAFDVAVYLALVVHLVRDWLDRRAGRQ